MAMYRLEFFSSLSRFGRQQGLCTGLIRAREGKLVGHHFISSYDIFISFISLLLHVSTLDPLCKGIWKTKLL
jgi:hypothetical protein